MEAKMSCEHNAKDGTRNDALNTENLKNDRELVLLPRITALKEAKMDFNCPMKMLLTIDGSDDASLDRKDAFKSQSFDQKWRLQMRPRRSCEVRRRLKPSIGS